jgi:hypothetical protein
VTRSLGLSSGLIRRRPPKSGLPAGDRSTAGQYAPGPACTQQRTVGKRVGGNPSRVRISYPPPVLEQAERRVPLIVSRTLLPCPQPSLSSFLSTGAASEGPQTASAIFRATSPGPAPAVCQKRTGTDPGPRLPGALSPAASRTGQTPPPAWRWCAAWFALTTQGRLSCAMVAEVRPRSEYWPSRVRRNCGSDVGFPGCGGLWLVPRRKNAEAAPR